MLCLRMPEIVLSYNTLPFFATLSAKPKEMTQSHTAWFQVWGVPWILFVPFKFAHAITMFANSCKSTIAAVCSTVPELKLVRVLCHVFTHLMPSSHVELHQHWVQNLRHFISTCYTVKCHNPHRQVLPNWPLHPNLVCICVDTFFYFFLDIKELNYVWETRCSGINAFTFSCLIWGSVKIPLSRPSRPLWRLTPGKAADLKCTSYLENASYLE